MKETHVNRVVAVLHSISDPVVVTNTSEQVTLANKPAETLLGFDLSPQQPKPLQECIHNAELLRSVRETLHSCRNRIVKCHQNDRQGDRWYDLIFSIIREGAETEPQGVLMIMHDVTKEKAADRIKTEFVSNVSHELRTPLASLTAYLEMLVDGDIQDDRTRQESYEVLQKETARMAGLVNNLLDISRMEAGVVKISKRSVSLVAVIREVLEVLKPQADENGITLVEELPPLFFHVQVDRGMISQAIFNLISNALKYTPAGGTVTVRVLVDEPGARVTAEVADTGVGISEEEIPKVFDKFYRVLLCIKHKLCV